MTALMSCIPRLETERLLLRAPMAEDLGPLAAFFASDRARFVGGKASEAATWRMLATELGHWHLRGFGRWSVIRRDTGEMVALVGLWFPRDWPEPEVGWDVMNGHEGHGYATEAGSAALRYAFDRLGCTTLVSLIKSANTASARVARRLGAQRDGQFEHEWHGRMDVWRYPRPEGVT